MGFYSTGAAEDGRAPAEELSCIRSGSFCTNERPRSGIFYPIDHVSRKSEIFQMFQQKLAHLFLTVTLTVCFAIHVESSPQVSRSSQQPRVDTNLVEEFSFVIKDLKVAHQGGNTLNITVRYRYKSNALVSDYPDFRLVAKDIETFLTNYPNDTDYWEIVNKKITLLVLDKYSAIASVTSQIEVLPTTTVPYLRSSITTRVRTSRK